MKTIWMGHFPLMAEAGTEGGEGGGGAGNSNAELDKYKADLETERKANRELKTKQEQTEKELAESRKLGLKSKEDYKSLYETEKTEREKLATKDQNRTKAFVTTARVNALKDECAKLGLLPEAASELIMQNLEDLDVEMGDDLSVTVKGAKEKAEMLKKTKPFYFKAKAVPNVNANGGQNYTPNVEGEVTAEDLQNAFKERLKKPREFQALRTKYREQLKSANK